MLLFPANGIGGGVILGILDPHGWALVSYSVVDALRYLAWTMLGGALVIIIGWYVSSARETWQRSGSPVRRWRQDNMIAREAERGIAEIETFLETRSPTEQDPIQSPSKESDEPDADS